MACICPTSWLQITSTDSGLGWVATSARTTACSARICNPVRSSVEISTTESVPPALLPIRVRELDLLGLLHRGIAELVSLAAGLPGVGVHIPLCAVVVVPLAVRVAADMGGDIGAIPADVPIYMDLSESGEGGAE